MIALAAQAGAETLERTVASDGHLDRLLRPKLTEQERSRMFADAWRDSGHEAAWAELRRAADYGDYEGMARANARIDALIDGEARS